MKRRCLFVSLLVFMMLLALIPLTAYADTLVLTSPNGGEQWTVGSTQTITWTGYEGWTFGAYLSTDSGANYDLYLGSSSGGSLEITVPNQITTNARIKLTGFVGFVPGPGGTLKPYFAQDNSNADFTIKSPIIIPPGSIFDGIQLLPILTIPNAPSNLETDPTTSTIILTWQDNSANEELFKVERKPEGGSFAQIATITANITAYTDHSAETGINYTYRVRASNALGNSPYSNEATSRLAEISAIMLPETPTGLTGTALSPTEVRLNWTDQATIEDGYYVERDRVRIATLAPNANTFTDTGLTPETVYDYRVQAFNTVSGESEYSNEVTVTTPAGTVVPAPLPDPAPGSTIVLQFYIDTSDYFIDGAIHTMDAAPAILEGRTVLPIRYVAEPLGAAVGWDPGPRRVRITHQAKIIDLWIGRNRAEINGAGKQIDPNNAAVNPVILPPGRTMLPLRFIAEELGALVDWDPGLRRVTITYPAP